MGKNEQLINQLVAITQGQAGFDKQTQAVSYGHPKLAETRKIT
jgi:hypothetical protein